MITDGKRIEFFIDKNDMELLCFVNSLGRHKSEVICQLLREHMSRIYSQYDSSHRR